MTPAQRYRAALAGKVATDKPARKPTTDAQDERDNRVRTVEPYHPPEKPPQMSYTNGMGGGYRVMLVYVTPELLEQIDRLVNKR